MKKTEASVVHGAGYGTRPPAFSKRVSDPTTVCHEPLETTEKGHGREEGRSIWVFTQVDETRDEDPWEDPRSLTVVCRGRKVGKKQSGGQTGPTH